MAAKIIEISSCGECPHLDHTGAFTPGGAKPICGHEQAVAERLGKEGGLSGLRLMKRRGVVRIPQWCPLDDA